MAYEIKQQIENLELLSQYPVVSHNNDLNNKG